MRRILRSVACAVVICGCARKPDRGPTQEASGTPAATSIVDASPPAAALDASVAPPDASPADEVGAFGQVLVRGQRVVGTVRRDVVVRRSDTDAGIVVAPMRAPPSAKLSATMAPFQGRADLLDITVAWWTEGGHHWEREETHAIVDISGAKDVLACVFAGENGSGGEYASSSSTVIVRRTSAKPLAFDVVRTTSSHETSMARGGGSPKDTTSKSVEHFEIGGSSCGGTLDAGHR